MERTLVILKPDSYARKLLGRITERFEQKGLRLVACKLTRLTPEVLREHYSHLASRSFYPRIEAFMSAKPALLQVWEGLDAVAVGRALSGPTNGREAPLGTIRGDFSMSVQCNLMHASDSVEAAEAEVRRFFRPEEVQSVEEDLSAVYSDDELEKTK